MNRISDAMVVVGESDEEEERQHLLSQSSSPAKPTTGGMEMEETDKAWQHSVSYYD